MSSEHGLYIPDIEHISSVETIIGYLRTVITEYNECLYCGIVKQSAQGVRRHMLDKGHCMINLEREPELLEFWEFSDSDGHDSDDEEVSKLQSPKADPASIDDFSKGEYTLPSGKVVGSKSKAREARRFARRIALATKDTSSLTLSKSPADPPKRSSLTDPTGSPQRHQGANQDRTVALRDAMGLIGVSDQQLHSLVTVQRKMQRQQAVVHASAAWADELGGRSQKHGKVKMNLRAG
jgi:pre-60S factor REI1